MSEADQTSDRTSDEGLTQARKRLNAIWREWGLQIDPGMPNLQMSALRITRDWLTQGPLDGSRAVRAAQYLLCDPETPGAHKREGWRTLHDALLEVWWNVATQQADVRLVQALILAVWETAAQQVPMECGVLLASAWEVLHGGKDRPRLPVRDPTTHDHTTPKLNVLSDTPVPSVPSFNWATYDTQIAHFQSFAVQGHQGGQWAPQLVAATHQLKSAVQQREEYLRSLRSALEKTISSTFASFERDSVQTLPLVNLLWWGQARYSRTHQKPYRRLPEKSDIAFWAAWESSAIAHGAPVEVEPAAAYLVEVLDQLHLNIDEQKPLREWMEELHSTLKRSGEKAPKLSATLDKLAAEDALGLPVTWVRLRAAAGKDLSTAVDDVALDLNASIDRGQWAAWIFRESLLDRHFAGDAT